MMYRSRVNPSIGLGLLLLFGSFTLNFFEFYGHQLIANYEHLSCFIQYYKSIGSETHP